MRVLCFDKKMLLKLVFWCYAMLTLLVCGCINSNSGIQMSKNYKTDPSVAIDKLMSMINSNFALEGRRNHSLNDNLDSKEQKFIKLSDFFSDIYWIFAVDKAEKISETKAIIYTSYKPFQTSIPLAKVNFVMIFVDDDWHLEDIEFEKLPEVVSSYRKIEGIITDSISKEPVSGALVSLFKKGIKLLETVTNSYGYYYFENLLPGTYDIVINRSGYEQKTIGGIIVN